MRIRVTEPRGCCWGSLLFVSSRSLDRGPIQEPAGAGARAAQHAHFSTSQAGEPIIFGSAWRPNWAVVICCSPASTTQTFTDAEAGCDRRRRHPLTYRDPRTELSTAHRTHGPPAFDDAVILSLEQYGRDTENNRLRRHERWGELALPAMVDYK